MMQTVLKEHNLDPAIKSNISTPSTHLEHPNPATKSNIKPILTPFLLNISIDTIKPVKSNEAIADVPFNINIEEEEARSLDQLLDRGYQKDHIPDRVLELLAQSANYLKDLTIADCSNVNGRLHY